MRLSWVYLVRLISSLIVITIYLYFSATCNKNNTNKHTSQVTIEPVTTQLATSFFFFNIIGFSHRNSRRCSDNGKNNALGDTIIVLVTSSIYCLASSSAQLV